MWKSRTKELVVNVGYAFYILFLIVCYSVYLSICIVRDYYLDRMRDYASRKHKTCLLHCKGTQTKA